MSALASALLAAVAFWFLGRLALRVNLAWERHRYHRSLMREHARQAYRAWMLGTRLRLAWWAIMAVPITIAVVWIVRR